MLVENELYRPFNFDLIKKIGTEIIIEATIDECELLAKRFSIPKINFMKARCFLKKLPQKNKGDYHLNVEMNADIIQHCVMTLNDVPEKINESYSIVFLRKEKTDDQEEEKIIDFEYEDIDIELINGNEVDLGIYIAEYLSLFMKSYPRQNDVKGDELGVHILNESAAKERKDKKNPFSVLESLKY